MSAQQASLTLTFVFTDIVGSTELLQRVGEEKARLVFERHHQQLTRAVAAHGGEELEWLGDGVLAAFGSSVQAIRCALAMRRTTGRPVAGQSLKIRIGVHTGEVMRRAGGYFGNTVVVARRLCDAADEGQILTSGFVASMLAGRQFAFREVGAIQLKGIDQPTTVFELLSSRPAVATPAQPAGAPPQPAPAGPIVRRRTSPRRWAVVAVVAIAAIVGAGLSASVIGPLLRDAGPSPSPAVDAPNAAVVQLMPLVLWRDLASGESRFDPVGAASGTIVDGRGVLLTTRAAVDRASYARPFDAIGVAFVDASGNASRPSHLAQTLSIDESGIAVLVITGDLQGQPPDHDFVSVELASAADVSVDDALALVGFTSVPDRVFRAPQTSRRTGARGFVQAGGRVGLIQTGASLSAGDHGGGAFADGRLIGVVGEDPSAELTAAVTPVDLARPAIDQAGLLLDARHADVTPTITIQLPAPQPAGAFGLSTRATFDGMVDGVIWSWSCQGPDDRHYANVWPPLLVWAAGSASAELELECASPDGFQLPVGLYRITIERVAPAGERVLLAEARTEIEPSAATGEQRWHADFPPPAMEMAVPDAFRCQSCADPYRVSNLLVLELDDPTVEIPAGLPAGMGAAQMAVRNYAGTEFEDMPASELAEALIGRGVEVVEPPREIEVDGWPGVMVGLAYGEQFEGSGPHAGAVYLPHTRARHVYVAIDGVSVGISIETVDTAGWEDRLDLLDRIVSSISFGR